MKTTQYNFNIPSDRPFFYTSFVSSMDGKIFVKKPGYWPIGTEKDYAHFTNLRAHADVILDGKNTALAFGDRTIQKVHDKEFNDLREELGKEKPAEYAIVSSNPNQELVDKIKNEHGYKPMLM